MNLEEFVAKLDPQPDYLVTVNRAWRRLGVAADYQLFPIGVRETLPCIPIPLTERLAESVLDLQWVFNQAYDRGPYQRGAVDYHQPPEPPLAEPDREWARQVLAPGAAALMPVLSDVLPQSRGVSM
jgi:hypothetical protein